MQKIFLFLLLTTVSVPLEAQADWGKMAEGMSRALITHYWPQAHAMDVIVDAWLRNNLYDPAEGKVYDNMNSKYNIMAIAPPLAAAQMFPPASQRIPSDQPFPILQNSLPLDNFEPLITSNTLIGAGVPSGWIGITRDFPPVDVLTGCQDCWRIQSPGGKR